MSNFYFKPGVELTFKSVVDLQVRLEKAIMNDTHDTFGIDLSDVLHCDSAGLALLIEARKLCKKYHKRFEMTGISADIQSLAEFCGVKGILQVV